MEPHDRPWWQGRRRFWVYAALLVVVPVIWTEFAYTACVEDELAVDEADGGTGDSLCGLAYLAIPPIAVATVVFACAISELLVRASLRRRASTRAVEGGGIGRFWFEIGCAVLTMVAVAGGILIAVKPWDEEPRQLPEYRQVLVLAEAHGEGIVPVVLHSRQHWPPAHATYAEGKAMTGPGNDRLQPLFRDINSYNRANLRRLRCLYWPVVDDVGDDIAGSRSLGEKCWPRSKPAAEESSLSYASLVEDPDD